MEVIWQDLPLTAETALEQQPNSELAEVAKALSGQIVSVFKNGAHTAPLGTPSSTVLLPLAVKNFILTSSKNCPCCSISAVPHSFAVLVKEEPGSFLSKALQEQVSCTS